MNKLKYLHVITLLVFTLGAKAQSFPELKGTTLSGQVKSIPSEVKGKHAVIAVAYSLKAQQSLATWQEAVTDNFLAPPKESIVPVTTYDAHLYFVPMLKGLAQTVSDKVVKDLKAGIDSSMHANVLVYEGEIKEYKDKLKMDNKDIPYFFVLDPNGKIVYQTSGDYTEQKMDKILEIVPEKE